RGDCLMKRLLIAAFLASASASSLADCPAPLPRDEPTIPSGSDSSAAEMARAGQDVRRYVRAMETYLDCRESLPTLQYNYLVEKAETLADAYNSELASFFGRADMLANK
ncbi:MAG: hypothetical protein RIC89_17820, partial [Pseudomonadales bacterium]